MKYDFDIFIDAYGYVTPCSAKGDEWLFNGRYPKYTLEMVKPDEESLYYILSEALLGRRSRRIN